MFDFFTDQDQKKSNSVAQQKPVISQPESEYDFVEKYVLLDPKQVMTQYNLWASCDQVPVAYEKQPDYFSMFNECVLLPSKYFIDYLEDLRKAPYEITSNPLTRTVYIVHLNNKNTMYIYPNLQKLKTPYIALANKKTLAFDVNPKINRALSECLKKYTR